MKKNGITILLSALFYLYTIAYSQTKDFSKISFKDSLAYTKSGKRLFTGAFIKKENGIIVLEGKYKNGMKDSIWTQYNLDGSFRNQKLYMASYPKIDWEELFLKDSIAYRKSEVKPFTGVVVLYYYIIKGNWSNNIKTKDINYVTSYRNGIPDGPFIGWHNTGKRFTSGCNVKGELNGKISYWRMDGSKQYVVEMKDGIYNGHYTAWHPNGTTSDKQNWKNGKRIGRCMQWFENGQLKLKFNYKSGHLNGKWKEWNKNAYLIKTISYRNDYENGKYCEYNDIGKLIRKGRYIDGYKVGQWREWYKNGQIKISGHYINSKRDGIWRWWNAQGELLSEEIWNNGILMTVSTGKVLTNKVLFYHLKLKGDIMYMDGDSLPFSGTCIIQYPDSSLREIRTYKFGKNDGPYIQYYQSGHKSCEGYYNENNPYGKQVFWYENGQKKLERYHYLQQIDGPWIEWYDNGQIKIERHFSKGKKSDHWRKWTIDAYNTEEGGYKNGKKDGPWLWRDEMGHILKYELYNENNLIERQVYK